jgi:hypothetical protein
LSKSARLPASNCTSPLIADASVCDNSWNFRFVAPSGTNCALAMLSLLIAQLIRVGAFIDPSVK